jgi:hypothetical protein
MFEQPVDSWKRVLEALLNLDAFVGPNQVPEDLRILGRRQRSLMATTLHVVYVFSDNAPRRNIEDLFVIDGVYVREAVENESGSCVSNRAATESNHFHTHE